MSGIEKSCSFVCLKWLLFAICFVLIYFHLMLILFSDAIANLYQYNQGTIYRTLLVESILSILFSLVGIIGAFKENYCCTVLFSIFMSLSVVTEIYSSIVAPIFWFLTILYIFVTMISFSFARHIRERIIEQVLRPQSAFMREYGRTYGLRFNSYQFYNQNNNPVIELQTIEFEGRQLPPYYSHDTNTSGMDVRPLPPYEELPPCPPSYQESLRNKNSESADNQNENNYVQHI